MNRWLPFLVVTAELGLVVAGVIDLREAAVALVVLEGLLAVLVASELALLLRRYRAARRDARSRSAALSAAMEAVLPPPIARMVRRELRVFAAIARALGRRREVGPDERFVTYGGNLRPLLIGIIVASVIEIGVVDLIVPWPRLRWTLAILGAYGLLWATGLACSVYTRPHTLGPAGLRLRFTVFSEVDLPAGRLVPAGTATRGSHRKTVEFAGGTLSFSTLGTTNVAARVEPPVRLDLGRGGRHLVDTVRFYADDPAGAHALMNSRGR